MPISHVGSTAEALTSATNWTLTLPEGLQEGDVVYAAVANANGGNPTFTETTTGTWTKLADLYQNDSTDSNLAVFRKVMGATPDTTVTIEQSAGSNIAVGVTKALRGVDTTTPEDATAVEAGAINGPDPNPGAITTATDGAWVVVFGASSEPGAITFPGGYVNTAGTDAGANTALGVADKAIPTATTEDPGIFDIFGGNAQDSWTALTIAVRPAPAAPVGTMAAAESGADVAALAGAVDIAGTLAVVEVGADVAVLSGAVLISGELTATEAGGDTFAAMGGGEPADDPPPAEPTRGGFGRTRRIKRQTVEPRGKTLRQLFDDRSPPREPIAPPPPMADPIEPADVSIETLVPDLSPLVTGLESLRVAVYAAAIAQAIEADDAEVLAVTV